MKKTMPLAALAALLVVTGCSSDGAKKESLADEAKALKGGPMPAGTWDKIAAQRKAFAASHGGAVSTGAPSGPSGAPSGG